MILWNLYGKGVAHIHAHRYHISSLRAVKHCICNNRRFLIGSIVMNIAFAFDSSDVDMFVANKLEYQTTRVKSCSAVNENSSINDITTVIDILVTISNNSYIASIPSRHHCVNVSHDLN